MGSRIMTVDWWLSDLGHNYFPNPAGLCTEEWILHISIEICFLLYDSLRGIYACIYQSSDRNDDDKELPA